WTAVPPDPVLAAPRKGGTLPAKHPPVLEYRQGAYSPFRPAPAQGNKLQHRAMATRACSSVFRARATICLSSSVQVDIRQSPLSKRITLRAGAGEWSQRRAENCDEVTFGGAQSTARCRSHPVIRRCRLNVRFARQRARNDGHVETPTADALTQPSTATPIARNPMR